MNIFDNWMYAYTSDSKILACRNGAEALAAIQQGLTVSTERVSLHGWDGRRFFVGRDRYGIACWVDMAGQLYYNPEDIAEARRRDDVEDT